MALLDSDSGNLKASTLAFGDSLLPISATALITSVVTVHATTMTNRGKKAGLMTVGWMFAAFFLRPVMGSSAAKMSCPGVRQRISLRVWGLGPAAITVRTAGDITLRVVVEVAAGGHYLFDS